MVSGRCLSAPANILLSGKAPGSSYHLQTLLITGKLFDALSVDVDRVLALKHSALKISDVPDLIVKKTITNDRDFVAKWQMLLFTTVALTIPTKYIKSIPRYIWDDRIDLNSILRKLEEDKNEH